MKFERSSGILLHPTSLPGRFGIGELGGEAFRFVDYLEGARQSIWQILPLGPAAQGNSPYMSFSSFAGNPLLISIEHLIDQGYVDPEDVIESLPHFPDDEVDFDVLIPWKMPLLRKAYDLFRQKAPDGDRARFDSFIQRNASWLEDYALFMALRDERAGAGWNTWEPELATRDPKALADAAQRLQEEVGAHRFWQYLFEEQWSALKGYCNVRGIKIMGDIPIYVAHDSADVWAHPDLFHLDEQGNATFVAGVPPDYFSATGQHWGNPIYRWSVHAASGFDWWIRRIRALLTRVDMLRIDHFRAFESYWEIPAGETSAINGQWVKGPGTGLFDAIRANLGELPIVAENLGIITPDVEALRKTLGFPGMVVLQFAFGIDRSSPGILPHTFTSDNIAYTGTHDNNTTVGWWNDLGAGEAPRPLKELQEERRFARKYLGETGWGIEWDFIRGVLVSPADNAIIPLQDVLGLGSEARMNTPGIGEGNWRWRYRADMLSEEARDRLRELTILYGRAPGLVPVDAL